MREFRSSGSVRGVPSNGHPYRDMGWFPFHNSLTAALGNPATSMTFVKCASSSELPLLQSEQVTIVIL